MPRRLPYRRRAGARQARSDRFKRHLVTSDSASDRTAITRHSRWNHERPGRARMTQLDAMIASAHPLAPRAGRFCCRSIDDRYLFSAPTMSRSRRSWTAPLRRVGDVRPVIPAPCASKSFTQPADRSSCSRERTASGCFPFDPERHRRTTRPSSRRCESCSPDVGSDLWTSSDSEHFARPAVLTG